jgi:hypothetical protein
MVVRIVRRSDLASDTYRRLKWAGGEKPRSRLHVNQRVRASLRWWPGIEGENENVFESRHGWRLLEYGQKYPLRGNPLSYLNCPKPTTPGSRWLLGSGSNPMVSTQLACAYRTRNSTSFDVSG